MEPTIQQHTPPNPTPPIPDASTNKPENKPKHLKRIIFACFLLILLALSVSSYLLLNSKSEEDQTITRSNTVSQNENQKAIQVVPASPSNATTQIKKTDVLDPHALPLGDGKVSSSPKTGYVFSCNQNFRGGGAMHAGNWIHGSTWDLTQKTTVNGKVTWPEAQFSISQSGSNRLISGNGLPVDSESGIFPIATSDPAYQYDRNPNSIKSQNVNLTLPLNPTKATSPTCVPMGMIGVALNGVAIFNALDDSGRDAVAHEVQDICDGHPQQKGIYHYHGPSECLPDQAEVSKLVGYALDGFGIYSLYDSSGKEVTNTDLDECHGTTSAVLWNGKIQNVYHYVLTREYPYTVGCFKGHFTRSLPPPR